MIFQRFPSRFQDGRFYVRAPTSSMSAPPGPPGPTGPELISAQARGLVKHWVNQEKWADDFTHKMRTTKDWECPRCFTTPDKMKNPAMYPQFP